MRWMSPAGSPWRSHPKPGARRKPVAGRSGTFVHGYHDRGIASDVGMVQGHRANDLNRSGRIARGARIWEGAKFAATPLMHSTAISQRGAGGPMTGAASRLVAV